jgi:hypothetical protein
VRSVTPRYDLDVLATGNEVRLAVAMLGIALAAGCGGSGAAQRPETRHTDIKIPVALSPLPATSAPLDRGSVTITIQGSGFGVPQTVNPGEPIELVNKGSATCALRSGSMLDVQVAPGGRASFTAPTEPGSYPLSCGLHPDLRGTLNVRGM